MKTQKGAGLRQKLRNKLVEHRQYIDQHDQDRPEVRNWRWDAGQGRVRRTGFHQALPMGMPAATVPLLMCITRNCPQNTRLLVTGAAAAFGAGCQSTQASATHTLVVETSAFISIRQCENRYPVCRDNGGQLAVWLHGKSR